jgi:PBP1b-binding outer membrane lipoprotein LpoB
MKKNLKFLLFAFAMLLTVCVQAENKPETVANVNPQPVVTMVSPETADVQQVACYIVIQNQRCGNHSAVFNMVSSDDCENLSNFIATVLQAAGCY